MKTVVITYLDEDYYKSTTSAYTDVIFISTYGKFVEIHREFAVEYIPVDRILHMTESNGQGQDLNTIE